MHSTAPDEGRTTPMYKHALMFSENIAHFIGFTTVYNIISIEFGRYAQICLYVVHHAINYLQFFSKISSVDTI